MENSYLLIAAGLAFILGLVHSIGGELMIFRPMVVDQLPPLVGSKNFAFRTLRAVWHTATAAILGFVTLLLCVALPISLTERVEFVQHVTALSFLVCSLIMAIGTRGKHPGWIALFVIAALVWLGMK